jgi:hypothetical protein
LEHIVSRAPSNFRQQDVARAIKAAQASGLPIARIEVDPKTAKITVIVGEPATEEAQKVNPWDNAPMPSERKRKTK